jgi:phosphatidate phosphatase APP1
MAGGKLVGKIFAWLRITAQPVVKAYDGYGDEGDILVYGHVLRLSPMQRRTYRQRLIVNLFSLVRLFIVRGIAGARVTIEWNGETREAVTDAEGHFQFEWKPLNPVKPGWSVAKVSYLSGQPATVTANAECRVLVPHGHQFNFISDIDDTFLVSHSSHLMKRLRVLFTSNARTRRPFEGVVDHYRFLAGAAAASGLPNPFFFVSSSEWNLYDYIREFCRHNKLPDGILLLSEMKRFRQLFATGQGKHRTKYMRIARILKRFPRHQYVLLGDNTQEDPQIYLSIVKDFPAMVGWVYIRKVNVANHDATVRTIAAIESHGVRCCYFERSAEAILHSRETGLISEASS